MATASKTVYSHITKDPEVCGGKACIDGTRVRVTDIVSLKRQGYATEQMVDAYPSLNLAQIHAALSYLVVTSLPSGLWASHEEDPSSRLYPRRRHRLDPKTLPTRTGHHRRLQLLRLHELLAHTGNDPSPTPSPESPST